jgi:hypothetical protein
MWEKFLNDQRKWVEEHGGDLVWENGSYTHCPHCNIGTLARPVFPACEGYPQGFEIDLTGERKTYEAVCFLPSIKFLSPGGTTMPATIRRKAIKPALKSIRDDLEKAWDKTWELIQELNLDPVSGDETKLATRLGVDLNHLRQEVEEAKTSVNKIIDYQADSGVTYKPRKKA